MRVKIRLHSDGCLNTLLLYGNCLMNAVHSHWNRGVDMVMETVQIRLTEKQIRNIDVLVKRGVYPNRSEAVRDAVRKLVEVGQ